MGTLRFTKMHGCGNDYVYVNCFEEQVENPEALAIRLSDRHKGIGGEPGRQRGEDVRQRHPLRGKICV